VSRASGRTAAGVAALLVLTVVLAVPAYWSGFGNFATLDDEGYLLSTLRGFVGGETLYESIYTQYGPFYYESFGAFFALTGWTIGMDTGRAIGLAIELLATLTLGLLAYRLSGRVLVGVGTQIIALGLLTERNELMHPAVLLAGLLVALAVAVTLVLPRRPAAGAALAGAIAAAMALTKINVGGFALIGLATGVALLLAGGRWGGALRWALAALAVLLAPALLFGDLGLEAKQAYALVVATAMASIVLVVGPLERPPSPWPLLGALAAGAAAATVAILAAIVLTGVPAGGPAGGARRRADAAARRPQRRARPRPHDRPVGLPRARRRGRGQPPAAGADRGGRCAARPGGPGRLVRDGRSGRGPADRPAAGRSRPPRPARLGSLRCRPTPRASGRSPAAAARDAVLGRRAAGAARLSGGGQPGRCRGAAAGADGGAGDRRRPGPARPARAVAARPRPPQRAPPRHRRRLRAAGRRARLGCRARRDHRGTGGLRVQRALPFQTADRVRVAPYLADELSAISATLRRECRSFVTMPGLNSFHEWTRIEPPVRLPTDWSRLLDADEQRRAVAAIRADRTPCLLYNFNLQSGWNGGRPTPRGPLRAHLDAAYGPPRDVGGGYVLRRLR
jgi:hypothetical protein